MTLKCVFHVTPASLRPLAAATTTATAVARPRMPSLLDLDIEWVDPPAPRGTSHETWQRARGWASED